MRNNSTCKCFSLAIEKSLLLQLHIFRSIHPALCFDGEGRERRRRRRGEKKSRITLVPLATFRA